MEMEMEMRATEDIEISTDITPPLTPLSFSPFSDLLTALHLLLRHHHHHPTTLPSRIAGLLSNRHKLTSQNDQISHYIQLNAHTLATQLAIHRGLQIEPNNHTTVLKEEATIGLCAVLTNAVEVHDNEGRNVGTAVFDPTFSWINHSCSPNASYRFIFSSSHSDSQFSDSKLRIAPFTRDSRQLQLQTFSPSSFEGNLDLCGKPLERSCPEDETPIKPQAPAVDDKDDNSVFYEALYMSMGIGFFTGFWGLIGSILLWKPWRNAYLMFLNKLSVNLAKCCR